ncbi:putative peptidoglycan glycosyltransferase FtsW [Myxococcaceae bacterium]|jgi:cell division protein FtsW|nr:putative peptidoglycan glycosyltransferase FtsW [Myxococcaceae bacterium]
MSAGGILRSPKEGRIDPTLASRVTSPAAVRGPLDGSVVSSVAILSSIGIVMVYSATAHLEPASVVPAFLWRHLSGVVAGVVLGLLVFRMPLERVRRLAIPFWAVSMLLLAATLVVGTSVKGASRWLTIPGLGSFQPSEFAKLATVLAVSAELARQSSRSAADPRRLLVPLGLAALPALLLVQQPDLGSAVVIVALTGLLVLLAGAPARLFVIPGLAAVAGVAGYVLWKPHAAARISGFLTPWDLSQREGFQLVQSFVAFGRGGLLGTGLGAGRQKLHYLPEAHTDFILAVVAEELGLIGVMAVLGAFVALLVAGVRIALHARSRFALFVAAGTTLLLTFPACMNAMVVTGLLPTKGLALPFLSYGRSNMLVCIVAVALLLGIGCREGAPDPPKVGAAERRGLIGT